MAYKIITWKGQTFPTYTAAARSFTTPPIVSILASVPAATQKRLYARLLRYYFCARCHHQLDNEKFDVDAKAGSKPNTMAVSVTIQPQACPRCPILVTFSVLPDGSIQYGPQADHD